MHTLHQIFLSSDEDYIPFVGPVRPVVNTAYEDGTYSLFVQPPRWVDQYCPLHFYVYERSLAHSQYSKSSLVKETTASMTYV